MRGIPLYVIADCVNETGSPEEKKRKVYGIRFGEPGANRPLSS